MPRTNIDARLTYNAAIENMVAAKYNVSEFKLTQSFLRLEKPIEVGRSNYQFDILVNEQNGNAPFNTEQRLNLQDIFVIAEVKFYLLLPGSLTNAATQPLSFINPFNFVDAAEAAPFGVLFNGKLQFSSMNNILVPSWDTDRNYFAPETQQTDDSGAGSPITERDGSSDGFYPMEPNVSLVGSKNNLIQLILPAGVSSLGTVTFARVGVWLRGILVQNSTIVN